MASHYRIPPRTLPEKQLCIRINLLKTGHTVVSQLLNFGNDLIILILPQAEQVAKNPGTRVFGYTPLEEGCPRRVTNALAEVFVLYHIRYA